MIFADLDCWPRRKAIRAREKEPEMGALMRQGAACSPLRWICVCELGIGVPASIP